MQAIETWLEALGLARYAEVFVAAEIDLTVLPDLTETDLERLGVAAEHRETILLAAAAPAEPEKLRGEAERRQVTVMFCELVRPDAPLDPEDHFRLQGAYHRAVAAQVRRFDGFVAKYMGEGALAYFGYPAAHEDDAERAVRAARALVEEAPRLGEGLQMRLGIATGLAVVGDLVGQGEAQERLIVGETPHLAARLQQIAEPGSILISAGARRLLGERFRLRGLGPLEFKGFAGTVEAFEVEGETGVESRFESVRAGQLAGFVGREPELGLLLDRWQLAREGEGQAVLLSGEAGIGKSRILRELRAKLEQEGAFSLRFHCSPYNANSAFYPIIDNYERALAFGRDETAGEKLDRLEALVCGRYGRPREDARFLAAMLSIPCEDRYGAVAMTAQRFKDETLRALCDTVEAIARRQPTVMLVEDVHWADPTTLEAMDALIQRLRRIPLLLVVAYRPEFVPRWRTRGHICELDLARLTRPQCGALVSRLAGKPLPPGLMEQILAKTDGVPLFAEELTKTILESGALRDGGEAWEYAGPTSASAIPTTLRDSLMARLDRVAEVKEIAQIGAAIGREFSYELVAAVVEGEKAALDRALRRLVASGLAFESGRPSQPTYVFKHALVRDAAYDSLLKRRRQELHGRIARVIESGFADLVEVEPELLAHHHTEAKDYEKAIPLWQAAGALAHRRMALAESIAHLEKSLSLVVELPPSARRDGLELDQRTLLGACWIAFRGWAAPEVWDNLRPALDLANALRRGDALLSIYWGIVTHVISTGRVAESLGWVKQMLSAAEALGDPDLRIAGYACAAISHFWRGELIESRQYAQQAISLYFPERHGRLVEVLANDLKSSCLTYLTLAEWMLGNPDTALKRIGELDEHSRHDGNAFNMAWCSAFSSRTLVYRREPDAARARAEECAQFGRENSMPFLTHVIGPMFSGVALIERGEFRQGTDILEAAVGLWEQAGGKCLSPYLKSVLAAGKAELGDLGGALRLIDDVAAQVERRGWEEREAYPEILRIKGTLLARAGDLAGAEDGYLASLDWARRQQARSWELRTAMSYARLLLEQGRALEARALLAPVYGGFTEGFGTRDLVEAKALLEELEGRSAGA